MGVRGLKSYIEGHSDVLRDVQFRNSKLVIDGSNLYFTLYFGTGFDQAHGGEYAAFEEEVRCFFANLRTCKIQPYVVLDGGDDVSNKKFETLKSRADERIRRAANLSRGLQGEALPILTKNVFKQLLGKLEVPLIQCIAEADWEAAALANEWNCPLLSNDSDFYIFDITAGFLPLSHFQWRQVASNNHRSDKFIPAKRYTVNNLCLTLDRMNKHLLPIFATILGNDYANLDKRMFPNWANYSPKKNSNIDGLLRWLSRFGSPKEAITALRRSITDPMDSVKVLKVLNDGLREYRLTSSSIAQFFTTGDPQSGLPRPLQSLPEWFLKALGEGKLNSILLDVLTLNRVTLNVSVQDFSLCSSNLTSRPIRQVFYGLMLQRTGAAEKPRYEVEEYDRQGLTLVSSKVAAILTNLQLDTLWEESQTRRLRVFLNALRVSQALDELLVPPNLQLAVYVTCYWLKHAQPEPKPEFFWALLVGLVYGELSRDPVMEKELPQKLKNLKSCTDETPLDVKAAHAYSQWQCSLRDSICLSQLLDNPVPEPEYTRLYSGLLVHRVVSEMSRGVTPESPLAGAPDALKLYRTLRNAVERELDEDLARRMSVKVKRVQRSGCPAHQKPMDDIITTFGHLMYEDEDDEDPRRGKNCKAGDEIHEEKCWTRTRHRVRSRTRDPKSKKHERSY